MMLENLQARGCNLLGYAECPSLEAQKQRLESLLLSEGQTVFTESHSMVTVYQQKLNGNGERSRVEKLELFDEFEEWELL
jgi:hypothetical protein